MFFDKIEGEMVFFFSFFKELGMIELYFGLTKIDEIFMEKT